MTQSPTTHSTQSDTEIINELKTNLPDNATWWYTDNKPNSETLEMTITGKPSEFQTGNIPTIQILRVNTNAQTEYHVQTTHITEYDKSELQDSSYQESWVNTTDEVINCITDFLTVQENGETHIDIYDETGKECIDYNHCTKEMITNNNIEHEFYTLCNIASSDVWELAHVHANKSVSDPDVDKSILSTGMISLIPISLTDAKTQTVIDRIQSTIDSSDTDTGSAVDTVLFDCDNIVKTINAEINRVTKEMLKSAMKNKSGTRLRLEIDNTYYIYDEKLHVRTIVKKAVQTTLEQTTKDDMNEEIRDTLINIVCSELLNTYDEHDLLSYGCAEIEFTTHEWTERATELHVKGGLPWKAANVAAITEANPDITNRDIADKLGIDESTVSRHISNIEKTITQATWLAETKPVLDTGETN